MKLNYISKMYLSKRNFNFFFSTNKVISANDPRYDVHKALKNVESWWFICWTYDLLKLAWVKRAKSKLQIFSNQSSLSSTFDQC